MVLCAASGSPALADPLGPEAAKLDQERLAPGIYPAAPAPQDSTVATERSDPPFKLDWSVGLKGSHISSSDGNSFLTTLNPRLSASHDGRRTDWALEAGAELARTGDGSLGLTALELDLRASTLLDHDTSLNGTAALDLTQTLPGLPGGNPVVTQAPLETSGALTGAIDRRLGRFKLGIEGSVERTVHGPSTRTDTGVTDNSDQNVWEGDARLRLGLQATPVFEIFGEAELGRDWFDRAAADGMRRDATSRALRAGLAGDWNGLLKGSVSVGVGRHDFDDVGLADISAQLYDASLTYSPDPTVNLSASVSTAIEPAGADANGTARVIHRVAANADYTVNSWLRLRASADWSQSWLEGSGESERRHGLGAGADYRINSRTALSADYGYAHRDNSASGVFDSHTVSLGVTLQR